MPHDFALFIAEQIVMFAFVDAAYRSDLRELNELNFARFDAKLEQRFAQSDAKLEQRFAQSDEKWEQRISHVERRFDELQSCMQGELAKLRAELIKWMFVFVATAALAVIGLR